MVVGIIQSFAQRNGIMQIFFYGSSPNAAEHGKPGKEIIDRLLVSHAAKIEVACTVCTSGTW
jgi:hypothetical protein